MATVLRAQAGLLVWGAAAAASITSSGPGSSASTPAPRYAVVDLGVIARLAADIVPGLSRSGKIVTWRQGPHGNDARGRESRTFTAVLLEGGTETRLPPPKGFLNSFAYSVNDSGTAVGWANTTINPVDSASTVHATLFGPRGARDLGTLGGRRSRAYAINNSDVVAGVSELATMDQRAFRFARGRMRPLDPLPGGTYSAAFDINTKGVIVGGSGVPSISRKPLVHAVLWRGDKPVDLGALEAAGSSVAYAVNDHDEVIGVSDLRGEDTVFLYRDGRMMDLGIRGHAFGINDAQQIVGTLAPEERHRPRGFLWENGVLRDLDSLLAVDTYRIEAAYRINDRGQILCSGTGDGRLHALLLNPIVRRR